MKYLVTVGIPVYNDAIHIEKCLQSVIDQTINFKNIEIICVDDGSTDETPKIINWYKDKYRIFGNISYFSHKNTGNPSLSRNKIIDYAQGEYIFFLDGDDYLGIEAIERMYNQGKKNDAEIVIGKYKGINRKVPVVMFQEKKEKTTFFDSSVVDSMNVLKMFKTSFVREKNIRFNCNIQHAEDHPFTMKAYLHAKTISIVNDYDCYYWTNYSDGNRTQLTKKLIPVNKFYDYIFETLDVINKSPLTQDLKYLASYKYWRRLLLFDIPTEFRRPRDIEERKFSFGMIKAIAYKYINKDIYIHFSGKEKLTLDIILDGTYQIFDEFMKNQKK